MTNKSFLLKILSIQSLLIFNFSYTQASDSQSNTFDPKPSLKQIAIESSKYLLEEEIVFLPDVNEKIKSYENRIVSSLPSQLTQRISSEELSFVINLFWSIYYTKEEINKYALMKKEVKKNLFKIIDLALEEQIIELDESGINLAFVNKIHEDYTTFKDFLINILEKLKKYNIIHKELKKSLSNLKLKVISEQKSVKTFIALYKKTKSSQDKVGR